MAEDDAKIAAVVRQSFSHGRTRTVVVTKGTLPKRQRKPKKRGPVTVVKEKETGRLIARPKAPAPKTQMVHQPRSASPEAALHVLPRRKCRLELPAKAGKGQPTARKREHKSRRRGGPSILYESAGMPGFEHLDPPRRSLRARR